MEKFKVITTSESGAKFIHHFASIEDATEYVETHPLRNEFVNISIKKVRDSK